MKTCTLTSRRHPEPRPLGVSLLMMRSGLPCLKALHGSRPATPSSHAFRQRPHHRMPFKFSSTRNSEFRLAPSHLQSARRMRIARSAAPGPRGQLSVRTMSANRANPAKDTSSAPSAMDPPLPGHVNDISAAPCKCLATHRRSRRSLASHAPTRPWFQSRSTPLCKAPCAAGAPPHANLAASSARVDTLASTPMGPRQSTPTLHLHPC